VAKRRIRTTNYSLHVLFFSLHIHDSQSISSPLRGQLCTRAAATRHEQKIQSRSISSFCSRCLALLLFCCSWVPTAYLPATKAFPLCCHRGGCHTVATAFAAGATFSTPGQEKQHLHCCCALSPDGQGIFSFDAKRQTRWVLVRDPIPQNPYGTRE